MSSVVSKVVILAAGGAAVVGATVGAWNLVAIPWLRRQDEECVTPVSPSADVETREKTKTACQEIIEDRKGKFRSLLKKHLTVSLVRKLEKRKTFSGATLWDIICAGYTCPQCEIGVLAPDSECYVTFRELFYPIIQDLHDIGDISSLPPSSSFSLDHQVNEERLSLAPLRLTRVAKAWISCRRNLKGFPMIPMLYEQEFQAIELEIRHALRDLTGEYSSFSDMDCNTYDSLLTQNLAFAKDENQSVMAAGGYRHWPRGRGVFLSSDESTCIFVNREDHLCITSTTENGDLMSAWEKMKRTLKVLSKKLFFAQDRLLGFLTMSPENVGSALRVGFQIQFPPGLDFNFNALSAMCSSVHMKCSLRGPGCVELWNGRCLGLNEIELLNESRAGVEKILNYILPDNV